MILRNGVCAKSSQCWGTLCRTLAALQLAGAKRTSQCGEHCFGNCAGAIAQKLAVKTRLSLLNRAVLPVLQHRDTRWPASSKRGIELNRLQRKMVASLQRLQKLPGEEPPEFVRRRNRFATLQIRESGFWSKLHCQRVLAWDAHCRRPPNSASWAPKLLEYHAAEWLSARRAAC